MGNICANRIPNHGKRDPESKQQAITAQQPAVLVDGKEGAPQLVHRTAAVAQTVAGGQIERVYADGEEEQQARNPDVWCAYARQDAADKKARDGGYGKGKHGAKYFGRVCILIDVCTPERGHNQHQYQHSQYRVQQKPAGFAHQVAGRFISSDLYGFHRLLR